MKTMIFALALLCASMVQSAEVQKILFLGNSITLHGPNKNIGWEGNWGMAASSQEKDYVHLVATALSKKDGGVPALLVKNIASFERQYETFDASSLLKETSAFGADLIIVAIGENAPALTNAASKVLFAEKTAALLKSMKGDTQPLIVVRSCFWANAAKDEALKKACQDVGGIYVDNSALDKDEKNFASSERSFKHAGVAHHPGDKGMQAIADGIIGAVKGK